MDRQEFVQAGSLEIGERLQTLSGDVKVVQQKLPRPGPQPVFNLEVHNEHVYFVGQDGVLVHNNGPGYSGNLGPVGRNPSTPISVTANEFQAIAKSVRRQVDKLNSRGIGEAGAAFQDAVKNKDFGLAGTIAHNRMFKRLRSRSFITSNGDAVRINRGPVFPGTNGPSRGYAYRLPDIQYGPPLSSTYRVWDFKGIQKSKNFSDPTGQFADILDWTNVSPTPLYYHWR